MMNPLPTTIEIAVPSAQPMPPNFMPSGMLTSALPMAMQRSDLRAELVHVLCALNLDADVLNRPARVTGAMSSSAIQ